MSSSERWDRVEEIYNAALEQDTATRHEFIADACRGDDQLRTEVESLMRNELRTSELLSHIGAKLGPPDITRDHGHLTGHTVGPYRVLSLMGVGGMGEVYLAEDVRLGRRLTLKVLPPELAASPDRMRRFTREARAASCLKHPNVATVYEIGQSDGIHFIAMEYVEGETVAERLKRGPVEVNEAIAIAIQVADALEEAHFNHIVHRDIKPANLILTPRGEVKVLDFGIAKIARPVKSESTILVTIPGIAIGTVSYMSPEQARGEEVDARSDLFSLGVVLYELATGVRPFEGQTNQQVMDAVIRTKPLPAAQRNRRIPAGLARVIDRALEKDRGFRYQTAADLRAALRRVARDLESNPSGDAVPAIGSRMTRRELMAWLTAGGAGAFAIGFATVGSRSSQVAASPVRFTLPPPPGVAVGAFEISPDGQNLALVAAKDGEKSIWIRELNGRDFRRLGRTTGITAIPFWSPDSRYVAYLAGSTLKTVNVSTGVIQVLYDPVDLHQGTWSSQGVIIFSPGWHQRMKQIAARGGSPPVDLDMDRMPNESGAVAPNFLPDGRHFLFSSERAEAGNAVYVGALDSSEYRVVVRSASYARYAAPGYIVFPQNEGLSAQPFNTRTLEVTGEPAPIAARVASYSVSQAGVLVYRAPVEEGIRLGWFARDGTRLQSLGNIGNFRQIALSPNEKILAIEGGGPTAEDQIGIWLYQLSTGEWSRGTTSVACDPVWSPLGTELMFSSNRRGSFDLYRLRIGGGEELVYSSTESKYAESWTADGNAVVYVTAKAFSLLPLTGERSPRVLLQSEAEVDEPSVSPDGRWVAYGSNETGRWEVFVAAFPSFSARRRISAGGGAQPLWRGDGREIFYLSAEGMMMAAALGGGESFDIEAPVELFQTGLKPDPILNQYAVSRDGQRFLFAAEGRDTEPEFTILMNWPAALKS